MKDNNDRKQELVRSLAITESAELLIRSYLNRVSMLFSLVVKPEELQSKQEKLNNIFDSAVNDIMDHIVRVVGDDFTLEELEKLNTMMHDPVFVRFNNFWKYDNNVTKVLFVVADKRAAQLVKELNELFPVENSTPLQTFSTKNESQLN